MQSEVIQKTDKAGGAEGHSFGRDRYQIPAVRPTNRHSPAEAKQMMKADAVTTIRYVASSRAR